MEIISAGFENHKLLMTAGAAAGVLAVGGAIAYGVNRMRNGTDASVEAAPDASLPVVEPVQ
jgi:hypothetical protein